jgi:hypothetical protein|tara:strand:- start:347 stop:643 length:297 start_codon:yes stop_codon:yes gene_type:complete
MNPLEYLFKSLRSLHVETELLEACNWDEDRVSYVKDLFESAMGEILSSSLTFTREEIVREIKYKMLESISEKELEVCLHIINGILENPEHFKGVGYEN